MSSESKQDPAAEAKMSRKAKPDDGSEMNIIYASLLVIFVVIGGWFVMDIDFSYYYYLVLCIFVIYLFAFVL
eukprot:UN10729